MNASISLKAECHYERLTGKNPYTLLEKFEESIKSGIGRRDILFLIAYTKDSTTTLESVEDMSEEKQTELFESFFNTLKEAKAKRDANEKQA